MLYKKNGSKTLSTELFKNPTAEYRGTPFWSWNGKLDKDALIRQIHQMKEMGFGGFHMHARTGLATEYLSDEFMELVKACFEFIRDFRGEVPGAAAKDCGNYLDMNLPMANYWGAKYAALLENITPDRLVYPE